MYCHALTAFPRAKYGPLPCTGYVVHSKEDDYAPPQPLKSQAAPDACQSTTPGSASYLHKCAQAHGRTPLEVPALGNASLTKGQVVSFVDAELRRPLLHEKFVPGGRFHQQAADLNRSQPPGARTVCHRADPAILQRVLPLAEVHTACRHLASCTHADDGRDGAVQHHRHRAAARVLPPGLLDGASPMQVPLNDSASAELYAELASGAKTDWDYSSCWLAGISAGLRSLNINKPIPVNLSSTLCNRLRMAQLYGASNRTACTRRIRALLALDAPHTPCKPLIDEAAVPTRCWSDFFSMLLGAPSLTLSSSSREMHTSWSNWSIRVYADSAFGGPRGVSTSLSPGAF
ncbi:hypothetical protein GGX14DRAFT_661910 [Mycena pura]|uniref:Uncharacterized protein n=1 Tax=Mycena pura TaxID=153505 RepID=A0AAD6V014_9AGAR|nr:hypothetical protein GGX14DRAFT_661910 [Mycena pura]